MEIIRLRAATVTLQAVDSTQTTVISYDQLLKSPIVILRPALTDGASELVEKPLLSMAR